MKTMAQFEKEIELSEFKIKLSANGSPLSKEEIVSRIKKVLEKQPKDMQLITQLKYLEKLNIQEISEITGKSKNELYLYLQGIVSDIDRIINLENRDFEEKYPKETQLSDKSASHILDLKL